MKFSIKIVFLTLFSLAIGAGGQYAFSQNFADFRIVVAAGTDKNHIELECTKGCAWKKLQFSCADAENCTSAIDGYGMAD